MRTFTKVVATLGVISMSTAAGLAVSYATVGTVATPEQVVRAPSGINESGESFGPEGFGDSFDLIAAIGNDGESGYVRSEDLNGPNFNSPEEAIAWQEQNLRETRDIPLYSIDGNTIIGTFTLKTVVEGLPSTDSSN